MGKQGAARGSKYVVEDREVDDHPMSYKSLLVCSEVTALGRDFFDAAPRFFYVIYIGFRMFFLQRAWDSKLLAVFTWWVTIYEQWLSIVDMWAPPRSLKEYLLESCA